MNDDELRDYALGKALAFCLSDYPADLPVGQVLDMVADGHDDIEVWQPFENREPEQLADVIEDMAFSLEQQYLEIIQRTKGEMA